MTTESVQEALRETDDDDLPEMAEVEAEEPPAPVVGVTPDMLGHLGDPTPEDEIEFRAAMTKGGGVVKRPDGEPMMLAYVTARFVQDRLDFIAGPENWQSTFEDTKTGAVRCRIGILVNRGEEMGVDWVWKTDVGTPTLIEADKGAHSDAFKRAGVQWGIARDLYDERSEATSVATPVASTNGAPTEQQTIRQRLEQTAEASAIAGSIETFDEDEVKVPAQTDGWVCPIHGDVKIVPAGVSARTGNSYNAFRACPVGGCDQKEPFKRR